MEIDFIFTKVAEIIEESCGISAQEIELTNTIFNQLGIDSIDFVDILFELESEFNVQLKISDIEKMAKSKMEDKPYEVDGTITPEGIVALKEYLPNLDPSQFTEGLSVHRMTQMVTVFTLCKMVQYRVLEAQQET